MLFNLVHNARIVSYKYVSPDKTADRRLVVKSAKRIGPRNEPWGTLHVCDLNLVFQLFSSILTNCLRSVRLSTLNSTNHPR